MILLYTLVLFLLVAVKFLTERRARALEQKYARAALAAEKLVREPAYRAGNGNRADPYEAAKRQFQLGALLQKSDRLETKCMTWQRRADKLGKAAEAVRGWKGRKLPYTFGVLDVSALLALADYLGVGELVSVRSLLRVLTALWVN